MIIMKCRSLYKNERTNNYNLVFFKSKGMALPYMIKMVFNVPSNTTGEPIEVNIDAQESKGETITVCTTKDFTYNYVSNGSESYMNMTMTDGHSEDIEILFYVLPYITTKEENKVATITLHVEKNKQFIYTMPYKQFAIAIPATSNYAEKQEGVAYSLIQRLSVLKNELWWQINKGIPLLDKIKNKNIFDSVVISTILEHPEVTNIISLNTMVKGTQYFFEANILTIYNETIYISNTLNG